MTLDTHGGKVTEAAERKDPMGPDSGRRGLFGALPFVLPQGSTDLFGAGSASAWRTFPQPGVGMRSSASSRPEIGQVKRLVLRL